MHESTERGDTSSSRNHDNILRGILGEQHCLPHRSRDRDFIPGTNVAEEIGAHSLLRGILLSGDGVGVFGASDAKANGVSVQ
jgi:hypothetical protein